MAKKLKEQELKELRTIVDKVNSVQIQIGGVELQKHDLLHNMQELQKELNEVQRGLLETYGDVSVDIKTGELKENVNPED
jgi:allophanate hydrolase subunit 1